MSLINEALKKAQRQRMEGGVPPTPEPPSDATAGNGPRVAKRDRPTDFRSQLLLLAGGGLALVCALVVAGFFLLRPKPSEAPAKAAPSVVQPAKEPAPTVAATAPATRPPETATPPVTAPITQPAVASNPPASTGTAPANVTPVVTAPTAAPVAVASKPAASPVEEPAKSLDKPKASPRMIAIVEALKVAGIRAAGAESKVLMNDRVYRLNDTIEHELNIRLTGVTAKSLTFEDDRGATYTRNF